MNSPINSDHHRAVEQKRSELCHLSGQSDTLRADLESNQHGVFALWNHLQSGGSVFDFTPDELDLLLQPVNVFCADMLVAQWQRELNELLNIN